VPGGGGADFTRSCLIVPWQLLTIAPYSFVHYRGMYNGPVRGRTTRIKNGVVNWSMTIESKEKAGPALAASFTDWRVAGLPVFEDIMAFFLNLSSLEKPLK